MIKEPNVRVAPRHKLTALYVLATPITFISLPHGHPYFRYNKHHQQALHPRSLHNGVCPPEEHTMMSAVTAPATDAARLVTP